MASKSKSNKSKGKGKKGGIEPVKDRHLLYTAAVQSVEADLDFFERVYRKRNKKRFTRLREDFCGTAVLACEWVRRRGENHAWGIDLDEATLNWGRTHYAPQVDAERLHLSCANVLDPDPTPVDLVCALNFSYNTFHTREQLAAYFKAARAALADGGLFVVDVVGGQDSFGELEEDRRISSSRGFDGTKIPPFTYIWEQAKFNPIDHSIRCKIHFKLKDGTRLRNAFVYDWRLWTLPELRELAADAGFVQTDVYVEGWDDEADESDGVFRKRSSFENQAGWVAYLVAHA